MTISPKPNLQLIYVTDIHRSTDFYKTLFKTTPVFSSPRYVAFAAGADALFALWMGGETPDPKAPRYAEIGIMLPSNEAVEKLYAEWQTVPEIQVAQEICTEVFGRTFMIKDPDGNLIRVCPLD